ncbi:hypothetical protein SKAU_G00058440 [Synaphobranchus kaupii]|uniref:Uncharacterized protein n=1 Tax=Synaphobranchus kaupii TaxID=118154 RepID=A0A9Q1G5G7_SYNKA|nr:hypothetical protein SKAU_G00058440 [Synaphobranchus kaupii]
MNTVNTPRAVFLHRALRGTRESSQPISTAPPPSTPLTHPSSPIPPTADGSFHGPANRLAAFAAGLRRQRSPPQSALISPLTGNHTGFAVRLRHRTSNLITFTIMTTK